jgi:hypothetical protein
LLRRESKVSFSLQVFLVPTTSAAKEMPNEVPTSTGFYGAGPMVACSPCHAKAYSMMALKSRYPKGEWTRLAARDTFVETQYHEN